MIDINSTIRRMCRIRIGTAMMKFKDVEILIDASLIRIKMNNIRMYLLELYH